MRLSQRDNLCTVFSVFDEVSQVVILLVLQHWRWRTNVAAQCNPSEWSAMLLPR
jgi:hypothetical protein